MSQRLRLFLLAPALVAGLGLASLRGAGGDAASELATAVKQGEELWKKPWKAGVKSCHDCHDRGANAMTRGRLQSYPKWDKALGKVVTAQQKLNQMIKDKSQGEPLELGSAELNALEAYIATRK